MAQIKPQYSFFAGYGEAQDDTPLQPGNIRRKKDRSEGVAWYDEMTNYERDMINKFCAAKGLPLIK